MLSSVAVGFSKELYRNSAHFGRLLRVSLARGLCSSTMEKIAFGNDLPGYEVGDKSAPAVIVLQEWWGVTDIIKAHAMKISETGGYRCLVPDLYKGKIGVDKEEASHLMSNLDFGQASVEMKSAVEYLKSSGSPKVGCIGFCMGGALSFCAAQHSGVDCAAPFYGIPGEAACQTESIKVPVQAHFGMLDKLMGFSDPKTAKELEERMKAAGVPSAFFYYENAGHAFMNVGEDAVKTRDYMGFPQPSTEAQETAWKNVFEFFAEHLKSQTST